MISCFKCNVNILRRTELLPEVVAVSQGNSFYLAWGEEGVSLERGHL